MTRTVIVAQLRQRWVEYVLAFVAVAAVVAVLIAHRAVTHSAEEAVHTLAHRLGKNMLVVPAATDLEAFHAQRFGRESLPSSIGSAIASSPLAQHVQGMQLRLYGYGDGGAGRRVLVVGDDGFPPGAEAEHPAPVVLGRAAAARLEAAPGSVVTVSGREFRVAQIASPAPDELEEAMFMPLATAQATLGRPGEISAARLAGCWCSIDVAALGAGIERLIPGSRAITVAGMLAAQQGSVAEMQRWSGPMYAAGTALVALLVAALVASQARRRTRELGLMVAIGAPPLRVAASFVAEAVLLGAFAGLAGWVLAPSLAGWVGARLIGAPVTVPPGLLPSAVALAAAVSAAAAAVPAIVAATKDPTVVLRES